MKADVAESVGGNIARSEGMPVPIITLLMALPSALLFLTFNFISWEMVVEVFHKLELPALLLFVFVISPVAFMLVSPSRTGR